MWEMFDQRPGNCARLLFDRHVAQHFRHNTFKKRNIVVILAVSNLPLNEGKKENILRVSTSLELIF